MHINKSKAAVVVAPGERRDWHIVSEETVVEILHVRNPGPHAEAGAGGFKVQEAQGCLHGTFLSAWPCCESLFLSERSYRCHFVSLLLHFQYISLGEHWQITQVLWPLLSMWESLNKLLSAGFSLVQSWPLQPSGEWTSGRKIPLCLLLSLNLPLKKKSIINK